MATGKWWVSSDVYLPEEVGHGLCACVYVLALHSCLSSLVYNQESAFSWMIRTLNASGTSNVLPIEHASSFSSCFLKHLYGLSDLGVKYGW